MELSFKYIFFTYTNTRFKRGDMMKKSIYIFFFVLILCININSLSALAVKDTFKEGLYKLSDLNPKPENNYVMENISDENIYVLIFNEKQIAVQAFQLAKKSDSFNLIPIKSSYRIVIVGKGEVKIS
ncbi:hypothetical protein D3C81_1057760 [compost metagenome]